MAQSNLKIHFVKTELQEPCEYMLQAFEICAQNSLQTQWLNTEDFDDLIFSETDIVVFETFSGKLFEELKNTKCVILGPWCLITCLTECIPIPNFPWPIYNVAMRNTNISCSNISKDLKKELENKIHLMAGLYSDKFLECSTHLITDSVVSLKYKKAIENKVTVMNTKWIDAVWNDSLKANVIGNSAEYDDYKVKPFENLNISITGFTTAEERNNLTKMINSNGGIYMSSLIMTKTNILICKHGTTSKKYTAALASNTVKCVSVDWLTESIKCGYALPEERYPVKRLTSTPTKENEGPNFSLISVISNSTRNMQDVYDETVNNASIMPGMSNKRKSEELEYIQAINNIDIKKLKASGTFLDGCSIYLVGFEPESKEKLCKILNFSGATRYDDINDRITHCIVGNTNCHELKVLNNKGLLNFPVVSVNWLWACIKEEQPVGEEKYILNVHSVPVEHSSPLSQKGLNLLRSQTSIRDKPKATKLNFDEIENDFEHNSLIKQYLKPGANTEEDDTLVKLLANNKNSIISAESQMSESYSSSTREVTNKGIFKGLKFLVKCDENSAALVKSTISELGGKVLLKLNKRSNIDYVVVPEFIAEPLTLTAQPVTPMWISECSEDDEIKDLLYYHKPIIVKDSTVLNNCVVTLTNYLEYERAVLQSLIVALGGVRQNELCRVAKAEKNILKTTHLLCPTPTGKKYLSALKWNLPIINKDWLIECGKSGRMVSLTPFLVRELDLCQEDASIKSNEVENRKMEIGSTSNVDNFVQNIESKSSVRSSNSNEASRISEKNISSIETLTKSSTSFNNSACHTPVQNKNGFPARQFSPMTPINKIIQGVQKMDTPMPETVTTPKPYGWIETPNTSIGNFANEANTPGLRKAMALCLSKFPSYDDLPPRRLSTPLSELKRRLWDKILPKENSDDDNAGIENICPKEAEKDDQRLSPPATEALDTQDILFNEKLEQLENKLSSSAAKRSSRKRISTISSHNEPVGVINSQPFTVGWDFDTDNNTTSQSTSSIRIFMLSGISDDKQKQQMISQLEQLGAIVSSLSSYDPTCTHLVCIQPSRNEKILSCMAAGKWILHADYVAACAARNEFIDEELYEYGNPKLIVKMPQIDANLMNRCKAIHYWRNEISKRGAGAFHDVRAIVISNNRDQIVGVIKAGGGVVLDISPPFYDNIYATHCFLEFKSITNYVDYIPLAQQGIYCVNTVYISDFLHLTKKNVKDCVLPYFSKYYSSK